LHCPHLKKQALHVLTPKIEKNPSGQEQLGPIRKSKQVKQFSGESVHVLHKYEQFSHFLVGESL
jgi:hypothetical protein